MRWVLVVAVVAVLHSEVSRTGCEDVKRFDARGAVFGKSLLFQKLYVSETKKEEKEVVVREESEVDGG